MLHTWPSGCPKAASSFCHPATSCVHRSPPSTSAKYFKASPIHSGNSCSSRPALESSRVGDGVEGWRLGGESTGVLDGCSSVRSEDAPATVFCGFLTLVLEGAGAGVAGVAAVLDWEEPPVLVVSGATAFALEPLLRFFPLPVGLGCAEVG